MLIGKVMGEISLGKTLPGGEKLHWVQVKTDHNTMVVLDTVGAKKSDDVLMVVGDGAWRICECCPVDGAVVGILNCC